MDMKRSGMAMALLLGANMALAAPGVTVSVTPERSSFAGSEDVVVTVTMTNTTDTTHYLVAWQTPFAGAPTAPLLDVVRDGQPVLMCAGRSGARP
jgi:peptidyl-Lys metalloendopeptidase